MAELKTKRTEASVDKFLNGIKDEQKRSDCLTIAAIMQKSAKAAPKMWGANIVGFGSYKYKYSDGREMDWMVVAFSPRKQNITLYVLRDFEGQAELLSGLGKHSTGKGCLYIKRLSDVHVPTLTKIVNASVQHALKKA